MKGLLQLGNLAEQMPLVYDWLKYAEGTRRIIKENYQDYEGEELLNAATEENVLTQIENLRSYPVVHSKLYNGQLNIYAWVYKLETGGVFVYSAERCNIKAEHEEEDSDTEEALANPVPL
jgi:carbonic anhydrase